MAEYIEKVAFNYAIREAVKKYPNSFYNGLEVARQIAHDFPATDVRPVVRGRWKYEEKELKSGVVACFHSCSVCGYHTNLFVINTIAHTPYCYCPNCGAWMEES